MNTKQQTELSKFLSLILRHAPETIGIELDAHGWTTVDVLLAALDAHGRPTSRADLEEVVRTNEKQRFRISEDGAHIRANQGHSVAVDLGLTPACPPEVLYHGTAETTLPAIALHGIQKRSRTHVHLSATSETALAVGKRHGEPAVLVVAAKRMHEMGYVFYQSDNNVWLTDHVPPIWCTRMI